MRILLFFLFLIPIVTNGQKTLIADKIRLNQVEFDNVVQDTALASVADTDIATAKAIKEFVLNRLNNSISEVITDGTTVLGDGTDANKIRADTTVVATKDFVTANAITAAERTKLAGIDENAEENVQADYGEVDPLSDAFIANKPDVVESETVSVSGGNTFNVPAGKVVLSIVLRTTTTNTIRVGTTVNGSEIDENEVVANEPYTINYNNYFNAQTTIHFTGNCEAEIYVR